MHSLAPRSRKWSSLTWIVSAATLAALLAIPVTSEAASAAPKCFGKVATIVGTAGDDKIKGTPRADVIVAKGGADVIDGLGGKDRICAGGGADIVRAGVGADWVSGGWGDDHIAGYKGDDKLFGLVGDDRILGGPGNDGLDGGPGTDKCFQGGGSGSAKDCEVADLAVAVSGPKNSTSGDVTFTLTVTNNGAAAASYTLHLVQTSQKATCAIPDDWNGDHPGDTLASGGSAQMTLDASCSSWDHGGKVGVDASVTSQGRDPDSLNNVASGKSNLKGN